MVEYSLGLIFPPWIGFLQKGQILFERSAEGLIQSFFLQFMQAVKISPFMVSPLEDEYTPCGPERAASSLGFRAYGPGV